MRKKERGFSLIELIIAIAILIILTGLLAPQFMKYIEKSREAKDVQAMDTVYSSVQAALANEAAYDAMITNTKEDADAKPTVYSKAVEDIIEKDDTGFGLEMKGLLGSSQLELKSKKATTNGKICVAVRYKEGTETVGTGDDAEKIETFAGFEVMVYCGSSDGKKIDGLQTVGADLSTDLPK